MNTTKNQIEIETLSYEYKKEMDKLSHYHCEFEMLTKELVRSEVNRKQRIDELEMMKNNLKSFKDNIPDFNQEIYELYVKYHEMEEEYDKNVQFNTEVDNRMKKNRNKLSDIEEYIKYSEERIEILKNALNKAQLEEKIKEN